MIAENKKPSGCELRWDDQDNDRIAGRKLNCCDWVLIRGSAASVWMGSSGPMADSIQPIRCPSHTGQMPRRTPSGLSLGEFIPGATHSSLNFHPAGSGAGDL